MEYALPGTVEWIMTEENSKYEIEFYEGSKEECLVEISFREAHKMLLAWGFTAPFCE